MQKHAGSYKTTSTDEAQANDPGRATRADARAAARRSGTLFAKRGFHATSLDAIAEEAGFSRGAVYYNFADKEELFLELLDRRCAERAQDLREVFADTDEDDVQATSRQAQLAAEHALDEMTGDSEWRALYLEFLAHAARDPAFRRRFSTRTEPDARRTRGSGRGSARAPSRARSGWSPSNSPS